jgi:hypothetical protein
MRQLAIEFACLVLLTAGAPLAKAQNFKMGDHVEALPYGSDWYPCVVTQGAPNYRVKCTNIDSTTSDYTVVPNRLRVDSGKVAAEMAQRWAQRFPVGSRVEAAPNGEQNGYHPCTVLSVKGNGAKIGIYHLKCDYGYENGPIEVDVGAVDHIRAASSATTAQVAIAAQAANRSPTTVTQGSYVCSTFTNGHIQVVPSLDMKVTGPSSYVDRGGQAGTFSYDAGSGLVDFRGGAWSGAKAKYSSLYGGQFKLMVNGHTANTDCNIRR